MINFYASNNTIHRVKRQLTGWEKIFSNHISDKRLISRIYKELLQINNILKYDFKMGKGPEKNFL